MKTWLIPCALVLSMLPGMSVANPYEQPLRDHANSEIRVWLKEPKLVDAIKNQNAENRAISSQDIDRLDKQWRAETKATRQPLIDKVLGTELSSYLKGVKDQSKGLYTEIFVMDNKGLNVGQSDVTSDYWQGDEAKWQKTYLVGRGAVHIGDVELDESTQMFQAQVSVAIVDPETNQVIGAVTVGVNVDEIP